MVPRGGLTPPSRDGYDLEHVFEKLNSGSRRGRAAPTGPASGRWATERRLAILRAAAGAFRKHGLSSTGMREIAEAAGLSPANLYYYFGGKDELVFFCQDHALDRLLAAADAAWASRIPARERLRRLIAEQVLCMLEELDGAVAHLEVDALPDKLRRKVLRKRDRYEQAVRRIVTAGVRGGDFRPCDPALVTRAILGAVNWTARWYRPDGPQTPAQVAASFSDYLVRGLLP